MDKKVFQKMLVLALVPIILISLGACFRRTAGTKVEADTLSKIKRGETTKAEVVALLGQPNMTQSHDGTETYMYRYFKSQVSGKTFIPIAGAFIGGASTEHQMVTITFDDKGIVQSVSSSQGAQSAY